MKGIARLTCLLAALVVAPSVEAQQLQGTESAGRSVARILGISPEQGGKCGSSAIFEAFSRWSQLNSETKAAIMKVVARPDKQAFRDSPSGRFRIHYDTSATDSPALITSGSNAQRIPNTAEQFIDSVAYYFEYAWKLEVDTLGYPAPPSDGLAGGGPQYDIYVSYLKPGLFGETTPDDQIAAGPPARYTSYISIDCDFLGFRTPGIAALSITAVHEFHHAIQMGDYGAWWSQPDDRWFYELTSVWMEHIGFPGIPDYLFDLPNYLQRFRDGMSRSYSLNSTQYGGYERSIWAQFLSKRFGREVIKNIWEGMTHTPALASITSVLQQRGSSLPSEYALFSLWNYYTADRADPSRYYDDGRSFPRFLPNVSESFNGLSSSFSTAAYPLSTQFIELALTKDTVTAIIANVDAGSAETSNSSTYSFELQASSGSSQPPFQRIAPGLALAFTASDSRQWRTAYVLSSTGANVNSSSSASPNPLKLDQSTELVLPIENSAARDADVYFLTSAMELVFSRRYPVTASLAGRAVRVPTSDLQGGLATGVYFVLARCADAEFKWKVAIIR